MVILDASTAALDPIAEYEIYRQFEELVEGKTAIIKKKQSGKLPTIT